MKDFPLYRSSQSCLACLLIIVAPLLLFSFSPMMGLYVVSAVLFLLPIAVCVSGLCSGLAAMAAGTLAGLLAMYRLLGPAGLGLAAVYLLPIVAAFAVVILKRIPFWKGCAGMIAVHLASLIAVYVLLQQRTGWQLYSAAGIAASDWLRNWELGDAMLYQLYSSGFIDLKTGLQQDLYVLSDAAREDMLLSVRTLVTTQLESLVPNIIVSQSIVGGVLCLLLPLRFGFIAEEKRVFLREAKGRPIKRGKELGPMLTAETQEEEKTAEKEKIDFPDIGMPPFHQWHIPRGKGWQVGAALIAGYLLRFSGEPTLHIAGVLLYAAASSLFSIQGAALVNFMQRTRGAQRGWRIALPIILMLVSLLTLIGIFDQINNIRGLRKPREPKEDF
ncbi:MAG: DUF2232 domain-containing protein [Clostridia bacterium]|nr:DUF2232 domain-containing protein [Clostridia bacterium]MBR6186438.1 DUF2232 domain-containing protein [Clostridia bacterium]